MATIEVGPHRFERMPGSERCRHCPAGSNHPVHLQAGQPIGTAELGDIEPDQADLDDEAARRETPAGSGPNG